MTTVIYIGLLILEGFPISMIIAGLFSNGLYFLLLRDFPFIELTSPVFIGGVGRWFFQSYHFCSVFKATYLQGKVCCKVKYGSN